MLPGLSSIAIMSVDCSWEEGFACSMHTMRGQATQHIAHKADEYAEVVQLVDNEHAICELLLMSYEHMQSGRSGLKIYVASQRHCGTFAFAVKGVARYSSAFLTPHFCCGVVVISSSSLLFTSTGETSSAMMFKALHRGKSGSQSSLQSQQGTQMRHKR